MDIFKKQPVEKIRKELLKAGHNEKFANSVAEGLKKSSVFRP